jgi:hypothetical protein
MVESEHFWQQLQWRKPKESEEAVPTIIVRVASALYELITGQCPPAPDMPDAPEPPGMVLIEEPQLAALIMDCARKPQRAPKTLDELRDKLSQIYDNPKVH